MPQSSTMPEGTVAPRLARWSGAICIWLALGLSLGWYYTVTYYGRSGWPMPTPDVCAALVLYYFSVLNVATEGQAIHWLLVFPVAGTLWVTAPWALAPRFCGSRPPFDRTLFWFSLTSIPMIVPAPWMSFVAGATPDGFVWHHMILVALRRAFVSPWPWLTPMYVTLGCISLCGQIYCYRKLFGISGKVAWHHFLASVILLTVAACTFGALAGLPLRLLFE